MNNIHYGLKRISGPFKNQKNGGLYISKKLVGSVISIGLIIFFIGGFSLQGCHSTKVSVVYPVDENEGTDPITGESSSNKTTTDCPPESVLGDTSHSHEWVAEKNADSDTNVDIDTSVDTDTLLEPLTTDSSNNALDTTMDSEAVMAAIENMVCEPRPNIAPEKNVFPEILFSRTIPGEYEQTVRKIAFAHNRELLFCSVLSSGTAVFRPDIRGFEFIIQPDGSADNGFFWLVKDNKEAAQKCFSSLVLTWQFPPPPDNKSLKVMVPILIDAAEPKIKNKKVQKKSPPKHIPWTVIK